MARKTISLRSAVITACSVATGSAASAATDALTVTLHYPQLGLGRLAGVVAALWIYDKLNTIIDGTAE